MVNMRWFRKHQKKLLVFFGVILMALFVLGSAMPWLGSGSGPDFRSGSANEEAKETVVSWNGGKLTRADMARMAALHFATIRFQNQLIQQAVQNNPSWRPQVAINPIPGEPQSEEFQRSLFGRYLLAQFGREKLDLVISPNAIDEYIYFVSDGASLSDQDWYNLNEVANRGAIDYRDIQEYMKMELAAMRVDDLLSMALPFQGLPNNSGRPQPSDFGSVLDQFLAYLQTEKRFECNVMPFPVADFLSRVEGEPTAAEIRELYDRGRFLEDGEQFEHPGFKRSRKVSLEFLRGDRQTFVDLAIQGVTKEEVLAEYNRLVEAKDPLVMENVSAPAVPGQGAPPPSESLQDPEKGDDPAPAPDVVPSDSGEGKSAETGAEDAQSADGKSDGDSANDGGGGGPRASIQEPGDDPAPVPQESAVPQQPDPAAPTEGDSVTPQEGEAPPPQTPAAQVPAAQDPAAQVPAAAQEPLVVEPEQRPKPLDDALELLIKQRLKGDDATKAFDTAMENAFFELSDYQVLLADYEASLNDPEGEKVDKPASLDLKAIADKYHLIYGSVDSADFTALRESEMGTAFEFDRQSGRIIGGAEVIFGNFDRLTPYYPNKIGGNYLYWVTEKRPSHIPTLEECRAEVVQFWKEQQAYELARAAAQQAADDVRSAGQTLLEKFPDQAKQTGEFAWFSATPPLAVENPGPEFMNAAYHLPPNDLAVEPNADRSIVYLIQKTKDDPRTMDELRAAFFKNLATFKQPYATGVPRVYSQQAVRDWVDHVNEQLGVRWEGF